MCMLVTCLTELGGLPSQSEVAMPSVDLVVPPILGVGFSFEQQKERLLLQYERDKDREDRERDREKDREERDKDRERERVKDTIELEKLRQESRMREAELAHVQAREQLALDRYRLDLIRDGKLSAEPVTGDRSGVTGSDSPAFDVSVNLRLLPKFSEKDPETFFLLFERLAEARQWSDAHRTLLLQCVLTGRAQEAFAALSVADSVRYRAVKAAVLKTYELVPEAYRQRFRTTRKEEQNYTEFARELTTYFTRWCGALEVETFDQLRKPILLEQFKNTLPNRVTTYLNERKVNTLMEAAVLADEFVLTHKSFVGESRRYVGGGVVSDGTSELFRSDLNQVCNYCLGKGHWKNECPVLKEKVKTPFDYRPVNPSALAAPLRFLEERASAVEAVRRHTKTDSLVASELDVDVAVHLEVQEQGTEIDTAYLSYVMDGHVSLVGSDVVVPVKILRDTGALDSFIVESVLPFSSESDTGTCVLVRGMGLNILSVPLHNMTFFSDLVNGDVTLGIRPSLPVGGGPGYLGEPSGR